MLKWCVLVGLDWAKPMMFLLLHVTCSCIHSIFFPYLIDIDLCWYFSVCHSLSLFLSVSCSMAPKRKSTPSWNPLCSGASFLLPPLIPLHLTSSFVMIKSVRTFRRTSHDEAFIWNAKLFYWIFPILTFPLSPIVGVGSHLSLHDHTRVLLQYAQIWLLYSSFYHSHLR